MQVGSKCIWDGGSGGNGEQNATSSFIRNYIGALPPIHDLAKQAGIELPDFLGSISKGDLAGIVSDSPESDKGGITDATEVKGS